MTASVVTTAAPRAQTRMEAITGLRFFAALAVVAFHIKPPGSHATWWITNLVEGGYLGVSFFFVLSGFILAHNYVDRFASGSVDRREFFRARFARIYPVYALALLVNAPHFLRGVTTKLHGWDATRRILETAALATTLTQAFSPSHVFAWNYPGWSLSVEAVFYLSFPALALIVARIPTERLWSAMFACGCLALLCPAAYVIVDPDHLGRLPNHEDATTWFLVVRHNPLAHLPQFLIGVLSARLVHAQPAAGRRDGSLLALLCAALVVIVALGNRPLHVFLHNGLLAIPFALLLMGVARAPRSAALTRFLSVGPLVLLGEASYATYILHIPLLMWMTTVSKRRSIPMPWDSVAATIVYVVVLLVTSVVVLRLLEEPARRALRGGSAPKVPA